MAKNTGVPRGSILFLRLTVIMLALIALLLSVIILRGIYTDWGTAYPFIAYLKYPVLCVLSATVIPFFIALYQTWQLLNLIDSNKAFSNASTKALRIIKYCSFIFGGLYIFMLPVVHYISQIEDAPGLVIVTTIMAGAPIVIGVFAGVFQGLLQSAIDIKNENDLTV